MRTNVVSDCPECRGVRTVFFGVCSVCLSEFDDWHTEQVVEPLAPAQT